VLTGHGGDNTIYGGDGDDIIDGGGRTNRLYGENGNDTFIFEIENDDYVDGGAGSDTLDCSRVSGMRVKDLADDWLWEEVA
jgi:Ca2+-binding RTX toxin-like protein